MTALVLSGGTVTGSSAQSPRTSGANDRPPLAIAQKKVSAGLPNFGEVTPTLYRGAQPTEQGLRKLKEMEFDIVVDFRANPGAERQTVTSLGMECVAIPWTCEHPEDRDIVMFIALARAHPGKKFSYIVVTGSIAQEWKSPLSGSLSKAGAAQMREERWKRLVFHDSIGRSVWRSYLTKRILFRDSTPVPPLRPSVFNPRA